MKERIPFLNRGPLVAVIRLNRSIGTGSRSQLNDEALAPVIEKAFKRGKPVSEVRICNFRQPLCINVVNRH